MAWAIYWKYSSWGKEDVDWNYLVNLIGEPVKEWGRDRAEDFGKNIRREMYEFKQIIRHHTSRYRQTTTDPFH